MSIIELIEPFSLIGGILCGVSFGLLVAWVKDAELRRTLAKIDNERARMVQKEDELYTHMVEYANEREKVEELRGHLLYKSSLLDEKLKSDIESKESLLVLEKELSQTKIALEEQKAQNVKLEKQLKGARARARRLSSEK